MKEKIAIVVLILLFIVSGCTDSDPRENGNGNEDSSYTGKNIVLIDSLSLDNEDLKPERYTHLKLDVSNGNVHPAEDFNVRIHNTGPLKVEEISDCRFDLRDRITLGELDSRRCRWKVEAPSKDYLKGFESKEVEMLATISYSTITSFHDEEPKLVFEENPETSEKTYTTDSGRLKAELKFESPVPLPERSIPIEISLDPGEGRAENIKIDYKGSFDFSECPERIGSINESGKDIKCEIRTPKEIDMREESPILVRINYKYELSKSIELEISES